MIAADRLPRTGAERLDWLRLARSRGVGPRTFLRLMSRFRSVAEALDALPSLVRDAEACAPDAARREAAAAARAGARMLCLGAADYPAALAEIADPPPLLWALGDPARAAEPGVAVVGARNASASGRRFAATLARDLGAAGWAVVSGLARGIDRAAHEASLETGTVAVVAGGVDVVYPPEHAALAAAIAADGLIVSEAPMGEQPTARSFPRRNRIVAGLSAAVVLVEAAERSGSLITARMALEQGREVMAVPGSPLDPRAAGCNALIREGAALIRSAADVAEALAAPRARRPRPEALPLAPEAPRQPSPPPAGDEAGDEAGRVLSLLGGAPVLFDDLARAAGLSPADLAAVLTELDIDGLIERRPGDLIARLM
ncbi:MAG: DNA-protecting protein DprA [Rhodobacteraceae bacterium]|nr:MAG: DNA-protecting protein DprA [Paracoccaceae bacterium]